MSDKKSSLRESKIEEVVDDLSQGLVETFDSRMESEDLSRYIKITVFGELEKFDLEFLNNLMTSNVSKKKDVYEVVIEKGEDVYMIGYIRLNNLSKYDTLVEMLSEKADITIHDTTETRKIPLRVLRGLDSSANLTDEELDEKYNSGTQDDRKKIKVNVDLY